MLHKAMAMTSQTSSAVPVEGELQVQVQSDSVLTLQLIELLLTRVPYEFIAKSVSDFIEVSADLILLCGCARYPALAVSTIVRESLA